LILQCQKAQNNCQIANRQAQITRADLGVLESVVVCGVVVYSVVVSCVVVESVVICGAVVYSVVVSGVRAIMSCFTASANEFDIFR
jgi:glucan phosphoethanolaminetransferase (alkaline phosphatase superfamily)